ncbi:hypothetical protein BKH43_06225 [Helicobacter sp. 13S00401-1]|uniref:tyrosine-type recombinase/integrase n=1 Tax=Helicobacter sp. 13S00401-1 TaxID=1905758 RepID=UPI000BA554B7|nr:site-specific integrase [Helicobacter sp. 13S00401-1]PAF50085.1 hypothetical protein BKH43_06225 [Helicobacter sp. 13S00401-1]
MHERLTRTKYAGVYTKTLKNDISFVVRYLQNKKVVDKVAGKQSEGMSAKKALAFKHILENARKDRTKEGFKTSGYEDITFKEVSLKYVEVNVKRWSAGSLKGYMTITKKLESYFSNSKILDISPLDIQGFMTTCLKERKAHTINAYLGVVASIFKLADEFYGIKNSSYLAIKRHRASKSRIRYLSFSEVRRLKAYILSLKHIHAKALYLFVCLSLSTGGRLRTILTIKKEDINLKEETINLFNYKINRSYKGYLDKECLMLLKAYLQGLGEKELIFKVSYQTMQLNLSKILNLLFNQNLNNLDEKVVLHTLRHTFASHLAIKGVPLQVIQAGLDHSNITMTMRYAHLSPNSTKRFILKALNG